MRVLCEHCLSHTVEWIAWADRQQRQTRRLQQHLAVQRLERTGDLQIEGVEAGLAFQDSPALTEITLPAVRTLGRFIYVGAPFTGSFNLNNLPKLTRVRAGALETTTHDVLIANSGELADDVLDVDLGALRNVGAALKLIKLANLESVAGFGSLEKVTDVIILQDLPKLRSVAGLNRLEAVESFFVIQNNAVLTDVNIPSLQKVNAGFAALTNPSLTSISLPAVSSLGRYVYVGGPFTGSLNLNKLPKLTRVQLGALETTTHDVAITESGELADRALDVDLGALRNVGGAVKLVGLANLEALAGFGALQKVTDTVVIKDLPTLRSVSGLDDLESVESFFVVQNNATLTTVEIPSLQNVNAGFAALANPALESVLLPSVRALGNYVHVAGPITGSLNLNKLPKLAVVELGELETTTHDVAVTESGELTAAPLELDFAELKLIGRALRLSKVANLKNLSAFPRLESVGAELSIVTNPCIADSDAMAFAAALTTSAVKISGNGVQCTIP